MWCVLCCTGGRWFSGEGVIVVLVCMDGRKALYYLSLSLTHTFCIIWSVCVVYALYVCTCIVFVLYSTISIACIDLYPNVFVLLCPALAFRWYSQEILQGNGCYGYSVISDYTGSYPLCHWVNIEMCKM